MQQTLIEFFGCTTLAGGIWNISAYLAFIGIIIGVFSERYRNLLFTLGPAVLALYAYAFLHNPLFTALQVIIVVSGILQWLKIAKHTAITVIFSATIAAYIFLASINAITDVWGLIGSFGLLGIALGLAVLPWRPGFLVMAGGGALLAVYGFMVSAWVFFFLNIFFAVANILTWRKQRG